LNSEFEQEFIKFEESYDKKIVKKPLFRTMSTYWLIDTSNIEKKGSILTSEYEWKEVTIDTGNIPPSRYLSLTWSDYILGTDLPIENFYKAIANEWLEYENKLEEVQSTLSIMKKVEWIEIDAEDYEKESFNNIVLWISKQIKVPSDKILKTLQNNWITSKILLKMYIDNKLFNNLEQKLNKELEQKKKIYEEALKQQVQKYQEILKQQDKKTEETLKYINQIKFDLFPQSLTSKLIKEFKTSSMTIPLPWWRTFRKETMDLENGMFWEAPNNAWWDRMLENLVMFMEKAIYGKIWAKNSIFKWLDFKMWATIDPRDFNKAVEENWILSEGSWNIDTIRNNLKKEIVFGWEDPDNEYL